MSILANTLAKYTQLRRQGTGSLVQRDYAPANTGSAYTINQGDWLDLSGEKVTQFLALPGANGTVTLNGASPKVIGIALAGVTVDAAGNVSDGSGRTTIPVAILDDSTEVLVRIYNATNTSAEQILVNTNTDYELVRYRGAAANIWFYAMATSTTNPVVKLMEKSIESSPTEFYGFVWVKALAAARRAG
jgi:hypothetical protein